MFVIVPLILLVQFEFSFSTSTCIPGTIIHLRNKQCHCDKTGLLNENNCVPLSRRQSCEPGQVIKDGCYECVCKIGGEFLCSNRKCLLKENSSSTIPSTKVFNHSLTVIGKTCTPFKSYFVNCSICVCPEDGMTEEARCNPQGLCLSQLPPLTNFLGSKGQNICIPNIIYIYPCLQCTCSDVGTFDLKECQETCTGSDLRNQNKSCHPKSYYKKYCNVCYCPEDGKVNEKYCEASECNSKRSFIPLQSLIEDASRCEPHKFSKPKCLFCDCGPNGIVNENSCTEMHCTQTLTGNDYTAKGKCNVGDVVPYCIECFCIQSGFINYKYCIKSCSLHSKLNVLQTVIRDSFSNSNLINSVAIKENKAGSQCTPNAIYLEDLKYCLCPVSGDTRFKICIAMKEVIKKPTVKPFDIKPNTTCEPLTFIQFDCNTCFCKQNGRLDPKWCTSDDCEAKKAVLEDQKENKLINHNGTLPIHSDIQQSSVCTPGSIMNIECNICICSDSGKIQDKACTRNVCSKDSQINDNVFTCDPLSYFEVDCNVCFCPRNGIKNVAKCTKNVCETYLRTLDCTPGELYSDNCNICVCPPRGTKKESICTNRDCDSSDDHWNTITKLTQALNVQVNPANSKVLNICNPGEEFSDGCKSCICPDMGLKAYSVCVNNCYENTNAQDVKHSGNKLEDKIDESGLMDNIDYYRKIGVTTSDCLHIDRRQISAYLYNNPDEKVKKMLRQREPEPRKACTPGTEYILDCKQCTCPLHGNIYDYCRPLPSDVYCDLRRQESTAPVDNDSSIKHLNFTHYHTIYRCNKPGRFMDTCFICECEETGELILEHCYKSSSNDCVNVKPTFLERNIRKAILGA